MTRERRRCACRGEIEANPLDHKQVETAVQRHQQTYTHRTWARNGGVERMGQQSTSEPIGGPEVWMEHWRVVRVS